MKATFVFPPIPYQFAKTPYPPLGIGYLAAVLRAQDVQVDLIDGQMIEENQFWQEIENLTADVVLMSATIRQIKGAELVAKIVKKHNPATTVILGGPGPSALAVQHRDFGKGTDIDTIVKGFTREKIIWAFDLCHRVGIKPGAYLIVGVPGETRQDIMDTVSLVERIEPSLLNFSFLTPFPNTALYTATQHWIGDWDYEQWDDFDATVYTCRFEVDPREARDMILDAYLKKISLGMPYSEYQFANESSRATQQSE